MQVLVPCLLDRHFDINFAPSRAEFGAEFGEWNPYWSISEDQFDSAYRDEKLHAECPYSAPGMPYDNYFG